MKLLARVDDYCNLILDAASKKKLLKMTHPGLEVEVAIDTERQRSLPQLEKYWCELRDIGSGMSEQSIRMLLQNIIDQIAIHGKIRESFLHDALKAAHGIDSINLMVDNATTKAYFDFAFEQIERMKRAFYA